MHKLIFTSMLFTAISCTFQDNSKVEFVKTEELTMEQVKISTPLLSPSHMFCVENNLIVVQRKAEHLFWLFNPENLEFKFSGGYLGRADNEFMGLSPLFYSPTDSGFLVLDVPGNLKEVKIKDDKIEVAIINKLKPGVFMNNFTLIDDSTFFFSDIYTQDVQFCVARNNGSEITNISNFPKWTNLELQMPAITYLTNTCINHEKGLIAAFYVYFNKIRLFNTQGEMIKEIEVGEMDGVYDQDNPYLTHSLPVSCGEYIYVLYQNKRYNEPLNPTAEVRVFDWDGNPVKRILFDKAFHMFTVSEDGKWLYAINNELEDNIYRCAI